METKKRRNTNFSSSEINLLMECLRAELQIIENKKTDGATTREKCKAWERVSLLFNSSNNECHRDVSTLKLKYENIKKNLKKKLALNRQNIMQTGGGPPVELKLEWYEELLYSFLKLGIDGLSSVGDCDNNNIEVSEVATELMGDTIENIKIIYENDLQNESNSTAEELVQFDQKETKEEQRTPNTKRPQTSNRWNLAKKPRTITKEKKQEGLENFDKLTSTKTQLTELQIKCYNEELDMKLAQKERNEEEFKIKTQILNIELKTKNENYNELLRENEFKKKMQVLAKEEMQLKIEILKVELNERLKQSLKHT